MLNKNLQTNQPDNKKVNAKKIKKPKVKKHTVRNKLKAYFNPNDVQKDMLRYQNHKFAYTLCMFAILLNCLGFCFVYSTLVDVIWTTGIDIIFNILFLLATFLVAENIKVYSQKASYLAMLLGVLEIGHFFWYSLPLILSESIDPWVFYGDLVCFISSGTFLIIAGVANFFKSKTLYKHLQELSKNDDTAKREFLKFEKKN